MPFLKLTRVGDRAGFKLFNISDGPEVEEVLIHGTSRELVEQPITTIRPGHAPVEENVEVVVPVLYGREDTFYVCKDALERELEAIGY